MKELKTDGTFFINQLPEVGKNLVYLLLLLEEKPLIISSAPEQHRFTHDMLFHFMSINKIATILVGGGGKISTNPKKICFHGSSFSFGACNYYDQVEIIAQLQGERTVSFNGSKDRVRLARGGKKKYTIKQVKEMLYAS